MLPKITKDNFYLASVAFFEESDCPNRPPDYISGSGWNRSEYWYERDYLYRCSNHWWNVRFCFWGIITKDPDIVFHASPNPRFKALNPYKNNRPLRLCGRVRWDAMYWNTEYMIRKAEKFFKTKIL